MVRKIAEVKQVTVAEARTILENVKEELGEFQKRALEYARKFSKISPEKAITLAEDLAKKFALERTEAIQIVNNMPQTISELRALFGKGRFLPTDQMEAILKTVKSYS